LPLDNHFNKVYNKNMVKIKYQGYEKRKAEAKARWLEIAADYNNGMNAKELAKKYKRTVANIYWALKQVKNGS